MNKIEAKIWIQNDKFLKKIPDKDLSEEQILYKAKEQRVIIPVSPSDKNTLFVNKAFSKWKQDFIESEFTDNEENMCPCIQNNDKIIWAFDTAITNIKFMEKSAFNNWRRDSHDIKNGWRNYGIESEPDYEGKAWYDRDKILQRAFNQKDTDPMKFVKKRMIPISAIKLHLKESFERCDKKYNFEKIWNQLIHSLELMGVVFFTCQENKKEKYMWYEDFAVIPYIAIIELKIEEFTSPTIPVRMLLDIEGDDFYTIWLFLNQASLIRCLNQYQQSKIVYTTTESNSDLAWKDRIFTYDGRLLTVKNRDDDSNYQKNWITIHRGTEDYTFIDLNQFMHPERLVLQQTINCVKVYHKIFLVNNDGSIYIPPCKGVELVFCEKPYFPLNDRQERNLFKSISDSLIKTDNEETGKVIKEEEIMQNLWDLGIEIKNSTGIHEILQECTDKASIWKDIWEIYWTLKKENILRKAIDQVKEKSQNNFCSKLLEPKYRRQKEDFLTLMKETLYRELCREL